ncbi:MAG: glycoside hydrolase family 32 protein, partial [Clostridiales bacterium]|nr:glycoside hydrolase family 32 protein [Clostridiales bacterium]
VKMYDGSLSPSEIKKLYDDCAGGEHPSLDYSEIALDPSVYEGDRYRPQYHAIPPAVWMNEPHSPFYYKGRYHVFYQANPSGPYWSQIRWGHIVSDDMIHWKYVKDAGVPTKDICPEGVWTGGACIGPDGTPWLAITAGTNQYGNPNHGGQNVAFAHAADPDDPDLTEWIVEDKLTITQPNDDSMGEREQFRDPFVWYDDETAQYFMLVSTSVPGAGGTANIYTSKNMHEWEHHGFLYECPYPEYDVAGEHWECVVLLPVTTEDGSMTKYVLFDCPQYARGESAPQVECYYWIGTFDKVSCRFIPDSDEPRLFDIGTATFTGQNGYTFLTDEERAAGKTYEDGRTVIYSIAQGKDAGTGLNYYAGWAHNFAFPLELKLSKDGNEIIRTPIREIESLYGEALYEYEGDGKTAAEVNAEIENVRGDTVRIDLEFTIAPTSDSYAAKLGVRYNPYTSLEGTERTYIEFADGKASIDRLQSTLRPGVDKQSLHHWAYGEERTFKVTVLLDRSMLEVYINDTVSGTARIYPHYGDSDYFRLIDDNAGMTVKKLKITQMKSAYSADGSITPPYYGNTGNLKDAE